MSWLIAGTAAGVIVLGALVRGLMGAKALGAKVRAALPGAQLADGIYRGQLELARPVTVELRTSEGWRWRLSCPIKPLVGGARFTPSDAHEVTDPLHIWLNALFTRWPEVTIYTQADGEHTSLSLEGLGSTTSQRRSLRGQANDLVSLAEALEGTRALVEVASDSRCPACRTTLMPRGALHELACPDCRGRFLPPDAVERLVVVELGLSTAELKAAAAGTQSVETCPGCDHRMNPMVVEDVITSLCTGCGGMWLDEGELKSISAGRYREV